MLLDLWSCYNDFYNMIDFYNMSLIVIFHNV